jgi:hypothetical protein
MRRESLCIAALLTAATLPAQSTVFVPTVVRARTDRPVAGAEIVLIDVNRIGRTDSLGDARMPGIPRGTHRVRVRRPGYVALDLELPFQTDSVRSVFYLEPLDQMLDTVRVVGRSVSPRLAEFESRRAMGLGRFLTEIDLQRETNREFATVAATHFPGLAARADGSGKQHLVSTRGSCGGPTGSTLNPPRIGSISAARGGGRGDDPGRGGTSGFGSCTGDTTCPILVFLDGMSLGQEDVDLDLARTWDLAGVEYYSGATAPVRYRISGSSCGVMLLWSK